MNEFDDLADLDDVFGPLRSVARPAELSQESATVDLMVNAHRTSEGKHMLTSRRARIATLVATGVLGFGGMAAASPKLGGDDPVLQDSTVESTEDLTVVQEVEPPAVPGPVAPGPVDDVASVMPEPVDDAEPAGDADPDIEFDESLCVVPGNHGKTVSAVARGDYDLGKFPESVTVTDAAHSSCGKNEPKVDGDDSKDEKPEVVGPDSEVDEPGIDDDSDDDSDDSKVKADRPDKSDKGAEKAANGNGNGNGNRNRDD